MDTSREAQHDWAEACCIGETEPTITYRTGLAVYEESLIKGCFAGRGWNGAGFVNFYDGRLDPLQHPTPQAFWLEVDGQLLASDWEWEGYEEVQNEKPHGAAPEPYRIHAVVTLRHTVRPVEVKVHTGLDGTPVMARWLEVTNTGTAPAALSVAFPWSGVLQKVNRWRQHLPDESMPLYSLGYMSNPHWGNEGDFQWHDLPAAGYRVDGRYRRDRHRHPMFALRNQATGEHFIGQLAWSGGYSFDFDLDADQGTTDQAARLFFRAGPDAPAPLRVIEPGETVTTPAMHLGVVIGDLDTALQAMHDHLRKSVFWAQPRGRGGWVESGIGPEVEITVDWVNAAIDAAADFGAEVFFIDASWYAPPGGHWWSTVGDWEVDLERFPDGLEPFRKRAHEHGMLWGLWLDAERLGAESRVAQQHPEWISVAYDGDKRLGDLIDLTNPEAAHWLEEQIAHVLETNELEFFRLDHNTAIGAGARVERHGYVESSYWRYYEAQYALYGRLRQRFPDVVFENCAGGGGRTDVGQVCRFSHTWVTDWQIAPRSFTITNGMTMALPPEYVDRLVGGQAGHTTAELDFQLRLLLFVRPSISFLKPPDMAWNPLLLGRVKHAVRVYKDFVRPFMSTGRMFHHTPSLPGPDPHGWGVLELASAEGDRAMCGLFQLAAPTQPEYLLRLRGLDAGRRYRVTFDSTGQSCEMDGALLTRQGIWVRLEGALSSELLLIEST